MRWPDPLRPGRLDPTAPLGGDDPAPIDAVIEIDSAGRLVAEYPRRRHSPDGMREVADGHRGADPTSMAGFWQALARD